ncbi:MAG: GTPase, partial [Lachnospiraceae bacterium]|nr:GTPase [Lachnospiraceae bacterium]
PVYMINGFLDSGKTMFIEYTISQPYFRTKGTTLLVVCEEGENEYDPELLKDSNAVVELVENEEDFTSQTLISFEKKHRPSRVIVEFNGMWNSKNVKFPWHWKLEQQITLIDGSTFSTYFTNMKSLLAEHIRKSEMILMNRCDNIMDKIPGYKRNIKAINQKADIIFEDKNGEVNVTLEEDLPYDVEADVIELNDMAYGVWYIDVLDNAQRYVGKTISYVGQVMKPKEFPKGYFVPGRMAMTCCAEDMAFLGYACKYDKTDELNDRDWIKVTAKVKIEYFDDYKREGPVLEAISIEKAAKPKEEVISFV